MDLFLVILGGLMSFIDSKRKKKEKANNNNRGEKMETIESKVINTLKNKIRENINRGLYIKSLGKLTSNTFTVALDGTGVQVRQLGKYILKWEHFNAIVKKANELGGKMYRGDALPQNEGVKLGTDVSHNCMEGFISRELLGLPDKKSVTRRSTYYSGILAWAGIVTLNNSDGKGSYIIVNSAFRDI